MKTTTFKASLYAIVAFLTPFGDKVVPVLFSDAWPTAQSVVGTGIMGIIAAAIVLRAYYDGSYERSKTNSDVPVKP